MTVIVRSSRATATEQIRFENGRFGPKPSVRYADLDTLFIASKCPEVFNLADMASQERTNGRSVRDRQSLATLESLGLVRSFSEGSWTITRPGWEFLCSVGQNPTKY